MNSTATVKPTSFAAPIFSSVSTKDFDVSGAHLSLILIKLIRLLFFNSTKVTTNMIVAMVLTSIDVVSDSKGRE